MRLTLLCLLLALAGFAQKPALAVGKLLIASPKVTNAQFRRTVVLIVGYGSKGAAGVILNRPLTKTVATAFPHVASAHDRTDVAFEGGPVQPSRVFCLVAIAGQIREARKILPNLYFSDNQNLMDLALNAREPAASFRVYLGFAGWTPEQLKHELASGDWLIQSATAAKIFDPAPATLWSRLTSPPASKEPENGNILVRPERTDGDPFAKYQGIGNPGLEPGIEGALKWIRELRGDRN